MAKRQKTEYPGVYFYEVERIGGPGMERAYYAVYKAGGKVHEEPVGRQYKDAMTSSRAARVRADLIEGRRDTAKVKRAKAQAAKEAEASRPTLNRLWEVYAAQREPSRSLGIDEGRYRKHLGPALGDKTPGEMLTLDVDRLRMRLLKSHSPQTTKHVLALLQRIIRHGVKAGLIDPPSPRKLTIVLPTFDNQKTEILRDEELARLIEAAQADENWQAAALVLLALATGMRRGELLNMRWPDIDDASGFITLPRTKSGKVQRVPLNSMTREVLAQLPRSGEFVFPGAGGREHAKNLYPALRRIRTRAGLPATFRPLHSLRHVYASRLASSGESLYVVQKLLRHSDGRMTQRYSHLADDALKRAAETASGIMEKATDGDESPTVVNLEDYRRK